MKEELDHIDDLIGKYLSGEAGEAERAQVEDWIAISKTNRNYVDHFKLIFDRVRSINQQQKFDADKAWLKVKSKMGKTKGRVIVLSQYWSMLRVAALLIIAVGLGYIAYQWISASDQTITIASQKQIVRDTLPDGSLAVLNKSSTIRYTYDTKNNQRKVFLTGEAFFDVKHQEAKPFVIKTSEVIIEDMGTSFNVKSFPESATVEVYVETGEVSFYTLNNSGLNLIAGETGVYHKESKSFERRMNPNTNVLAYKTRIFHFNNENLGTIVGDLNAVYDTKIILKNINLKNCRLNVSFSNEPIDDIVEIIAETLKLKLTREGEEWILDGTSCED